MNKYTIPGQQYSEQMSRANALANLKSDEANRYQTKANQGVATQGQLWGAVTGGATSILGNMYAHDKGPFAPDKVAPNNGYSYDPFRTDDSWKNQKYNPLDY